MAPKIDFTYLRQSGSSLVMQERVDQLMAEVNADNLPIMTDLNLNEGDGGIAIKERLQDQEANALNYGQKPWRWRIKAIRDERGVDHKPGDKIVRVMQGPLKDRAGRPISGHELSIAVQDGTFEEKYCHRKEWTLDGDCCFTCTYTDAAYFLALFGVHYKTKSFVGKFGAKEKTGKRNDRFIEIVPGVNDDTGKTDRRKSA